MLDGDFWRLTYSADDDRAPAWSAGGDSVYYVTARLTTRFLPRGIGVLLAVPTSGGAAAPLVSAQVQERQTRWFSAPALAEDGRLALVEVVRANTLPLCPGVIACDGADSARVPPLAELAVRVHDSHDDVPAAAEPRLLVPVEGRRFISEGSLATHWHPFQTVFEEERKPVFRPSWDPAGSRIAFSDGLRLLVWEPPADSAVRIAGTEDGVMPAWSPDGEWLAFEHLERADSTVRTCHYDTPTRRFCTERRIVVHIGRRTIRLIRPGGTDLHELTEGEDPAWAPDGSALYIAREDAIWRVPLDGGPGVEIPHTEGGQHPAVSPDGSLLAFVRETSADNRDVWVVRIPADLSVAAQ